MSLIPKKGTVYVVDDDEAVRDSLQWLLEGNAQQYQRSQNDSWQVRGLSGRPVLLQMGTYQPVTFYQWRGGQVVGLMPLVNGLYATATLIGDRVQIALSSEQARLEQGTINRGQSATEVSGAPGQWLTVGELSTSSAQQGSSLGRHVAPRRCMAEVLEPLLAPLRRAGEDSRPGVAGNDVSAYLVKGQAFLEAMRAASLAGDHDLLRRSAMSLKGVARLLGAFELATLCAEMEAAPAASTRALSPEAVQEIEAQFNLVRSASR